MVLEGKHNRIVILSTQTQQHFFIHKSIRKPGPSPPSSLGRIFYHYPFIVKFFILHLPYIICTKIIRKSLKSENSFLMCHFHDYKKNLFQKIVLENVLFQSLVLPIKHNATFPINNTITYSY